jgi:hypothetical protein
LQKQKKQQPFDNKRKEAFVYLSVPEILLKVALNTIKQTNKTLF